MAVKEVEIAGYIHRLQELGDSAIFESGIARKAYAQMVCAVDGSGNIVSPGAAAGTLTNNNAAPGSTNLGALTALANAAAPTWSEGKQVLLSVDLSGRLRVMGIRTNNLAPPSDGNVGALIAIANAAAPTWTEGNAVLASTDLAGNTRVTLGTLIAGEDQANNVMRTIPQAGTGTITSVASSASDVTILAANATRKGGGLYNDSTAILYLALSNVTSSATVYTVQVPPSGYYEFPFGYAGILKGIWAAANGSARITEWA